MKTTTIRTMLIWSAFLILIAGSTKSMTIDVDKKGIITGRISNFTTNEPIEFVSVDLYAAKDSMMVVGTITDFEGQFTITMLDSGNYYVEITLHDYENKLIQPVIIDKNIWKVNLGEILISSVPHKSSKLFSRAGKSIKSSETQIIFAGKN